MLPAHTLHMIVESRLTFGGSPVEEQSKAAKAQTPLQSTGNKRERGHSNSKRQWHAAVAFEIQRSRLRSIVYSIRKSPQKMAGQRSVLAIPSRWQRLQDIVHITGQAVRQHQR